MMALKEPAFSVKIKIDYKFVLISGVLGTRMLDINRVDWIFKLIPYFKIPLFYLVQCI